MAALVRLDTELIRRRRAELGFSVRAAAEAIGITGPTYNKLENAPITLGSSWPSSCAWPACSACASTS